MSLNIKRIISSCFVLFLINTNQVTIAAEDRHLEPLKKATEKYGINIKSTFASNCSWCHGIYGMKAGKGPQLAGTKMTLEETIERIANGKSGYMPGYLKTLGKEKVEALANYIKMLPKE